MRLSDSNNPEDNELLIATGKDSRTVYFELLCDWPLISEQEIITLSKAFSENQVCLFSDLFNYL
jgi:hypothetical protein